MNVAGTHSELRERLSRTRWTDEAVDAGWRYGTNQKYLRNLADHWLARFDWRTQEAEINRFAHYRADVDGIGIHFIHERGKGDRRCRSSSPTDIRIRSCAS